MSKYKRILRKIALIILVLFIIYFMIGALASIAMIVIEAITHQMSLEIQEDNPSFQPWIIYVGIAVMTFISVGMAFGVFMGYRSVKKIGQPKSGTHELEIE